jgi:hypothetical protein
MCHSVITTFSSWMNRLSCSACPELRASKTECLNVSLCDRFSMYLFHHKRSRGDIFTNVAGCQPSVALIQAMMKRHAWAKIEEPCYWKHSQVVQNIIDFELKRKRLLQKSLVLASLD